MLTFGSLFAGIGGFDLGFERAGMVCRWQVEIDPFCQKVLAKHWPNVRRYGDIRDCGSHNLEPVDIVCGGFPCQDVSVAGRRAGLAGKRSGLWSEFARIVGEIAPEWVVIENVPGLLSSQRGADFATVLQGLVRIGYGMAWRVFDAQYFRLAQRRSRVFIVGSLGNGRTAEVLFERDGVSRDSPPRREAAQAVAATIGASSESRRNGGSWPVTNSLVVTHPLTARYDSSEDGCGRGVPLVVARPLAHASTINHYDASQQTYVVQSFAWQQGVSPNDRSYPVRKGDVAGTISGTRVDAIAFTERSRTEGRNFESQEELAYALTNPGSGGRTHSRQIATRSAARRLTPRECERLQGFPDDYTAGQKDSPRYRQLGNAVCVPVAEWIGRRIMEADHGSA